MKFLEGKTPAERNKIIAAVVLGFLAVVAIGYNLLPGSTPTKKSSSTANINGNTKIAAANSGGLNAPATELPTTDDTKNGDYYGLSPIPENPFPPVFGGETSRNIFAIYVPSPRPVVIPTEKPQPLPSPVPTPPIIVQFVSSNPNPVYARQADFTLELGGDKFTEDSKVLFNGQEIPTQFGGAQRLTAKVPAAMIATEGQRQIMVRTPDGSKISNVMIFNVQAPPVPNYSFVGLVARKRYNNDTALLQDKQSKEYKNVRLGETVGRFKVVSISSKEVVMQDTALAFRHNLPFVDERTAGRSGSGSGGNTGGQPNNDASNNGFPPGFDPNVQIQYQSIPGIPNQYTQPQQMQPMPQPSPKKDSDDDNDEDN